MNVATIRITRGPYRVVRRLARKLVKPLRLAIIKHQLALSGGNIQHLEDARVETLALLQAEHMRQVDLLMKLNQVAGW